MVMRLVSMMEVNIKRQFNIKLLWCSALFIVLSLCCSCNFSKDNTKDDSFTFIGRNAYTTNSYNGMEYYRLNKTKEFMDGYYVVGNEVSKWEEFEVKKGLLNGDYIVFHPNGEIFSKTQYGNGKRDGLELNYSAVGVLIKKSTYKNDILIGSQYSYFDNGKIRSESKYKDGKRIETLNYNLLGHITSQSFIKDGRTITQRITGGKVFSEHVKSNYDAYETFKFFNEDGSTKLYLRQLEQNDTMYILELNDEGEETKRVDLKANPQEAIKYFSLFQESLNP